VTRSAAAVLAAALALLVGCGGTDATGGSSGPSPASPQQASGRQAALTDTAVSSNGTSTSGGGQQQPATDPFWGLIAETRGAAGKDTGAQSELLRDRLSKLSPSKIIEFEGWWQTLDRRLYTWDVWGAAYIIEDGCSDDCFRDFRAYVILLGKDAFNRAVKNPDSLAGEVSDSETGDWEGADNVAPDAYSTATDTDFPTDTPDLSGNPRGTRWSDGQLQALMRRYPQLASRFR
jgi:hypothetical protein